MPRGEAGPHAGRNEGVADGSARGSRALEEGAYAGWPPVQHGTGVSGAETAAAGGGTRCRVRRQGRRGGGDGRAK
eukprot:4037012-Pleurochrysis_carterae.AAC.1